MLTLKAEGMEELRARLAGFSERRINATMATALTRTAVAVKAEMTRQLPSIFDRPTPYTMRSLFMRGATAQRLQAQVWFKDDLAGSGTPATKYLVPNVQGGARHATRLEVSLAAIGALPKGWRIVPGAGARLDAFGNVSRGQIIQVLSQLRITLLSGFTRNMSYDRNKAIAAQRKAGGRFFVVRPGQRGELKPGIYQREFVGRNVTPVFMFVQRAVYKPRFDFDAIATRVATEQLPRQVALAVDEQLLRAAAAGRSGARA